MEDDAHIHIGTSGWQYDDWAGDFYPDELAKDDWFAHYAGRFDSVEINNTFYGLPALETARGWRERAPEGFSYVLKANQYITHRKKLLDPEDTLPAFLDVADALGDTLAVLLFQLPPNWHANPDRLADFLEAVPDAYRCAVEFRDPTWYDPAVYEVLEDAGAAFCIHDFPEVASPKLHTADFAYVRFHGATGKYVGSYEDPQLCGWAGCLAAWLDEIDEVYCYFNNTADGAAPRDAARLREMVRS